MSSDVDIESEIQETAREAVNRDEPFVSGIMRTDINDVDEFGDFEYYAWERYFIQNKSRSSILSFFNAVKKLEEFVDQSDRVECSADNIGKSDAKRFKMWLIDDVKERTAADYINQLDNMAQYYLSNGYYSGNPFEGLISGIANGGRGGKSASFQSNERISVDDNKLREAIRSTHGTQKIVLLSILVKTGVRISEALNLDWEDVNINHSLADDLLPKPRSEISNMSDTIYIDSNKTEDLHSEINAYGNKRKVDSYIPFDSELKRLLLWHALTRERRFDGENPVLMVNDRPVTDSNTRLGKNTAYKQIVDFAKEHGWHESGRSEKKNVTPHWFRAKFSSYMSNRLEAADDLDANPQDIVKGMRGDVGVDVIEDYRLREDSFASYIRPRQFKIGLEGM